jgi:anti-sigma factor RsiW
MECGETRQRIQDLIDGRLPPGEAEEVRGHLRACAPCADEEADLTRVGDLLRLWSAARVGEREPQLSALWTRVRAGIDQRRSPWHAPLLRRWFFVPAAAALAVLILLFYPSDGTRAPFHPKSFDVTVESLESDTATVALVDKGEELPRVIWVIENGKT